MRCSKCLSELPANALYCHICGTKQPDSEKISEQIDAIDELLAITGSKFSNLGRADCQEWIQEFGFEEVVAATNISVKQYLEFDKDDQPIRESVIQVFQKIPGICYNRKHAKNEPYLADISRFVNYAAKQFYFSDYRIKKLREIATRVFSLYYRMDNYDAHKEDLFWRMRSASDKWEFYNELEELADTLGEQYHDSL